MTEVIITGTGVPLAAPGRAGAGVLVRHDGIDLQFDAGRATGLRLAEAGARCRDLRALFVTHHHSDHLTGLQDVLFSRWLEMHGDFTPLPVVAPRGPSINFLEAMMVPWAGDIENRRAHTGREDRPDPEVIGFDTGPEPTVVWESEGVRVTAVAVHHEPVSPSVAYRVDTADGAVVISGDTRVCDEVASLAAGADVLVHEVFETELVRPFMADLPHLAGIADYHADAAALAAMAHRIAVPTLVLTHLIPAPRDREDEKRMADDMAAVGYDGEVVVARDLTTVRF
jgi:ribonuclease Z